MTRTSNIAAVAESALPPRAHLNWHGHDDGLSRNVCLTVHSTLVFASGGAQPQGMVQHDSKALLLPDKIIGDGHCGQYDETPELLFQLQCLGECRALQQPRTKSTGEISCACAALVVALCTLLLEGTRVLRGERVVSLLQHDTGLQS